MSFSGNSRVYLKILEYSVGISGDNAGDEAKIFGVTDSACTSDYLGIPGGAGLVADATAAAAYAADHYTAALPHPAKDSFGAGS